MGTPGCSSETIVGNNKTETATETETETEMIEGAVRAAACGVRGERSGPQFS